MEPRTKYAIALAVLMLVVLGVRLAVTFQAEQPSYQSYFAVIQAESIRETGLPRYDDPYSYEGRRYAFSPLYYYVIAAFTFFVPPPLAVKVLPSLFMAGLVPLIYLIGHHLTKNRGVSFLAALFAGFSQALFVSASDAAPLSLALPLAAALLLSLLDLEQHPVRALLLAAALTFVSPLIWLFLAAEIVYLVILAAERLTISVKHLEAALFMFLLAAWYTLLTYKEPLRRYGLALLSESLPQSVRQATFAEFTLLAMIYAVGLVPLALASLSLYHTAFEERNRSIFLVAALGLVVLLAASLQLLPLPVALILLNLVFVILSAPGLHLLAVYLRKTRFEWLRRPLIVALLLLFLLTSLLPAIAAGLYPDISPKRNELLALSWLRDHTADSSVILAAPKTGFLINEEARRKYVADEEYLLIANPDAILADIDAAYTTPSTVRAVEITAKYGVTHIFMGSQEHTRYSQFGAIIKDPTCFPLVYRNPQVLVFGVNCTVEARQ